MQVRKEIKILRITKYTYLNNSWMHEYLSTPQGLNAIYKGFEQPGEALRVVWKDHICNCSARVTSAARPVASTERR
jgi:hypothetical protein